MGKGKKHAQRAPPNQPHNNTPTTSSIPDPGPVAVLKRKRSISQDRQSSVAPFHTPPTSPATPAPESHSMAAMLLRENSGSVPAQSEPPPAYTSTVSVPYLTADDIASSNQDIVAMADLFSTMKKTLASMTGSLDRLRSQSEQLVACTLDIQAAEQLNQLRRALDEQISRQRQEIEAVRIILEDKIRAEIEEQIRSRLRETVKDVLRDTVREKVRMELERQVPENLRQEVIAHQRQILEVKAMLHNSEARRYNSLQTSTRSNAPLRPLLRPLPTPEQSPVVLSISRSSSLGSNVPRTPHSAVPSSAMPSVPAPTPIKRSASNPFTEPLTASTHFPADLRSLFAMGPDQTRQLLRDYGLASEAPTPAIERPPKDRGLPIVNEEPDVTSDEENKNAGTQEHAADMNRFMAHIGVPFLMVPGPKVKQDPTTPMSSRTRRKMFLTPLIIK